MVTSAKLVYKEPVAPSMKARLIRSTVLGAYLVVPVTVGLVVAQYSLLLSIVAVVASVIGVAQLVHRPFPNRRFRERDDLVLFKFCRTGALTRIRKTYGLLPSDPRCRLCLIPFKGVGRVLGVRPSRKNPNFCPS